MGAPFVQYAGRAVLLFVTFIESTWYEFDKLTRNLAGSQKGVAQS